MSPHDRHDTGGGLDDVARMWDVEGVLAALAQADAEPPPASSRNAILDGAARRPRPPAEPVDPVDLYRCRSAALGALLPTLDLHDWVATASPYRWTVHGLVAHLLQIERYTLHVLTDHARDDALDHPVADHLSLGADAIVAELANDPAETATSWIEVSARVIERAVSDSCDLELPAPLHGWPFTRSVALVVRAFEIWTHTDDICRATGRALVVPPPGELRTMSSASVRALPLLVQLRRPGLRLPPTRVVLTGPGGGTFDIGHDTGERAAVLTADVVDYCRVAARRLDITELVAHREGDAALIDDLLLAAGAIAV